MSSCVLLQWWVNEEKEVRKLGKKNQAVKVLKLSIRKKNNKQLGSLGVFFVVLALLPTYMYSTFPQQNSYSSFNLLIKILTEELSPGEESKQTIHKCQIFWLIWAVLSKEELSWDTYM